MTGPNVLYYGDNLDILRRYIRDESIDLVYLDPPFNSNASYNVLFGEANGSQSAAQVQAFEDTWHWALAARSFEETVERGGKVGEALEGMQMVPWQADGPVWLGPVGRAGFYQLCRAPR